MARAPIIPAIRYRDAPAAIEFLCEAFGFVRHLVVPGEGDTIAHAQLRLGHGMIMVGSAREDEFGALNVGPAQAGGVTQSAYVVVEAIEAHYARAKAHGAEIVMDLEDQGGRGPLYVARDPEGHVWSFGSYDPWAGVE
ncbi:MAG: VOC family protein [Myxococcota bacterium]